MTKLLIKCFIKNHTETKLPSVREAYGRLGSIVGILANLILCLTKLGVGIIFNSIAILADGFNNLSDAGSSIVTLVGFKLSSKPADEDHPFGHARIEYISGLIISFIIFLLGFELIKSSISKIINPEPMLVSLPMIIVLVFSIILKLWLSYFNHTLGKLISSSTLEATATDSRNDVIATSAILIAIIISHFTGLQLDGYLGCLVGVFILYSGYGILIETTNPLLGQAVDSALTQEMGQKLLSYEGVLGYHDLVVHSYGPNHYFASVHVEVSADEDLLSCHDKLDLIERDFARDFNVTLVIHPDPIIISDPLIAALRYKVTQLIQTIHPHLSIHDFRIAKGTTRTTLIFDVMVPAGYKTAPKDLATHIDSLIKTIDVNYQTVITVDMNYTSTSITSD